MPNRGLDELSVSDGTGEAVTANITADRAISATTLVVDSVDNWPQKFIFATGTLNANNYITPASLCIMYGHLDTGDIIIDGYAPGYSDSGNTSGQVAIIKPATYWADEVVALAQVVHDNDGKLKVDAPITGGSTIADGWISAEPASAWTYSAWSSTTRIAQITVPTDATTQFQAGDRVKFTQTTDGVKYGIIVKVEATTLHVFLPSGTDFDNETISAPFYSRVKAPFGFPLSPSSWSLKFEDSGGGSVTVSTSYQSSGDQLVVPIGAWNIIGDLFIQAINGGSTSGWYVTATLSTDGTGSTDNELTQQLVSDTDSSGGTGWTFGGPLYFQKHKTLTAETTFTLMAKVNSTGNVSNMSVSGVIIRAVCAYL